MNSGQHFFFILCMACSLGGGFLLGSCRESSPAPEPAELALVLEHQVGGEALEWEQLRYTNAAGNHYSLSRLEYYLSGLELVSDRGVVHAFPDPIYVNAREEQHPLTEISLPAGNYQRLSFFIGLSPEQNCSGCLPPSPENLNMAWPDGMGGGYHFLKLEGRYSGQNPSLLGYALHLGTNACLVPIRIEQPFTLGPGQQQLRLRMEVQEWFQNPETYCLDSDGNYSMGDAVLMQKIARNGQHVFTFSIVARQE
jgi:hypothetical protein